MNSACSERPLIISTVSEPLYSKQYHSFKMFSNFLSSRCTREIIKKHCFFVKIQPFKELSFKDVSQIWRIFDPKFCSTEYKRPIQQEITKCDFRIYLWLSQKNYSFLKKKQQKYHVLNIFENPQISFPEEWLGGNLVKKVKYYFCDFFWKVCLRVK